MCRQPQGDPAPRWQLFMHANRHRFLLFAELASWGLGLASVVWRGAFQVGQARTTPERSRTFRAELTVADDFRFIVNGQPMSVKELKPGMRGRATITTKTTVTPVTVTEVTHIW
jgi:hypothetical protein